MVKAEERARKAHARKLRNRDAALRSNLKRSQKYKQLVGDVEAGRIRLAALQSMQTQLLDENARLRAAAGMPPAADLQLVSGPKFAAASGPKFAAASGPDSSLRSLDWSGNNGHVEELERICVRAPMGVTVSGIK
jgi:hypothetical protein